MVENLANQISEIMDGSSLAVNYGEPLWFLVLVLIIFVVNLCHVRFVHFISPGEVLKVGLMGCVVDTSLLADPQMVSFDSDGFGGHLDNPFELVLVAQRSFQHGRLKIKTMDGEISLLAEFDMGAFRYYLVSPCTRYIRCGWDDYALASDVLLGIDFSAYDDSEMDQQFLASFVKRLSAWEREVQGGAFVRPTARKHRLPLPLLRHLAQTGKHRRLSRIDLTAYREKYQFFLEKPLESLNLHGL